MADVINVEPGDGSLTRGLQAASTGDTLRLAPGKYTESVVVPAGITIEGASADTTIIEGTSKNTITLKGEECRIVGVTICGSGKTMQGIESYSTMRIERCRFSKLSTGIYLFGAPLSDIVACDFLECGIGIEATSSACPTIWGCQFVGGGVGLDFHSGQPYIRNCVFWKQEEGILLSTSRPTPNQASIRHSLFFDCKASGAHINFTPDDKLVISYNIFARCHGAAAIMPFAPEGIRQCLFDDVSQVRDLYGTEVVCVGKRGNVAGKIAPILTDGELQYSDSKAIVAVPENGAAETRFGPESEWRIVGVRSKATLPPMRFGQQITIVNSVIEESPVALERKLSVVSRSREALNGKPIDRLICNGPDGPVELIFDVSRIVEGQSGR